MAFAGTAFLILWHDLAEEGEREYHLWHTREHMPERVGHPGFLRARRGVNWNLSYQRYLTIYEGESLESFRSDAYYRSLNSPTEWTTRVAPHFRNFLRMACARHLSRGRGVGGAVSTYRCNLPEGRSEAEATKALEAVVDQVMEIPEVSAAHIGVARPEYSDIPTRETELRPRMQESPFDMVLVVEGIGLTELTRVDADISAKVVATGLTGIKSHVYDMAYLLAKGTG